MRTFFNVISAIQWSSYIHFFSRFNYFLITLGKNI